MPKPSQHPQQNTAQRSAVFSVTILSNEVRSCPAPIVAAALLTVIRNAKTTGEATPATGHITAQNGQSAAATGHVTVATGQASATMATQNGHRPPSYQHANSGQLQSFPDISPQLRTDISRQNRTKRRAKNTAFTKPDKTATLSAVSRPVALAHSASGETERAHV